MNQDYNITPVLESTDVDSKLKPGEPFTQEIGAKTYCVEPLEGGSKGVQVTVKKPRSTDEKEKLNTRRTRDRESANTETEVVLLPPIVGRYFNNDSIVYLIPREDGVITHQFAKDIDTGNAWLALGLQDQKSIMRSEPFKSFWVRVANSFPVTSISPKVTEGLPPTAPEGIRPTQLSSDAEARKAVAHIGRSLAPQGRWVAGLALLSPWLGMMGGESAIVHLWGEGGAGKSILGKFLASLYGASQPSDDGLFLTFDSSPQGLSSHAVSLSYYPLILDEINSSSGSPEEILTSLVMGAQRKRATRNGAAARARGRWAGVAFTTGNMMLGFKHEMFDRRLISIQAPDLWQAPNSNTEPREAWEYWSNIHAAVQNTEGHPWVALQREFTPGTDTVSGIADLASEIPLPVQGNIGTLARLGIAGCNWLAEWSGESLWTEGVENSIATVAEARAKEKLSPFAEFAEELLDRISANPAGWDSDLASENGVELQGFPQETNSRDHCATPHSKSCSWMGVLSSTMEGLATTGVNRLLSEPLLLDSLNRRNISATGSAVIYKVRTSTGRHRVYSTCVTALESHLGRSTNDQTPKDTDDSDDQEDDMAKGNPHKITILTAVENTEAAVSAGYHNLVVECSTTPNDFKAEGWSARATENATSFNVTKDEQKARIWVSSSDDLKEFARGLHKLLSLRPDFTSPTNLAHQLIHEVESGKSARYQINDELGEIFKPEDVLHAQTWGLTTRERKAQSNELDQWDRNKAHLVSIAQCNVAPLYVDEEFEHFGEDAPIDNKHAGFYRMALPVWDSVLPNPMGNNAQPGDVKWVSNELVNFLQTECGTLDIHEAWLAPVHRVHALKNAREEYEELLTKLEGTTAKSLVKTSYQAFAGTIGSYDFSRGKGRKVYRPDWAQAIRDASWCNVLRTVKKVYNADNRFVPVAVNVDAIYYPKGLGVPPEMRIGDAISQFKHVEAN